jgi:hypothetical protein
MSERREHMNALQRARRAFDREGYIPSWEAAVLREHGFNPFEIERQWAQETE